MKHLRDPYFWVCVRAALDNERFVENWRRLHGLDVPRTVLDRMVDKATGRDDWVARTFLDDVKELIYDRCPEE